MGSLYFDCQNGISGDMAVGALIDLGADVKKLDCALKSLNLDNEFEYKITKTLVNSIQATDFNVILKHHHHDNNSHHHHRNLEDIIKIINSADTCDNAKTLAKKIFNIVAGAESIVHNKPVNEVHFHEVGAIDSIVDILSFSVLFCDINPDKTYFSSLGEGFGYVDCAHGRMNVPVPAVVETAKKYSLPLKKTNIEGEMITPTGVAIVASLYNPDINFNEYKIIRVGLGRGKRPYPNPILRVMEINEKS